MFETAFGIPAHPLLIHVAVVFVPLLMLGSMVYGLVPRWRSRVDWALATAAIVTPISCFVARQSGLAFRARLVREHAVSDQDLARINQHQSYGTMTFYLSVALAVVALAMVGAQAARRRRAGDGGTGFDPVSVGLLVLAVVGSAAIGYYVFKTGDTGAHIVWQGR